MSKTIRVLLADDHPAIRVGVATILEADGDIRVVAQAGDGRQAVALYREQRPDVAILDLQMPVMGGVHAIAEIRRETAEARTLVLSMHAGDEDLLRSLHAGAMGYVLKGATADELVRAVRAVHAGRKHLGLELAERLRDQAPRDPLTSRELEILQLMARGLENRAIAEALGIGVGTVKWHVVSVLAKLDAPDRTNAVLTALRRGLIHLD